MEFFLDTVNLEEITHYQKVLPLAGVTSNPTILKAAGNIDFFTHLQAVKERIGEASLHVQVVGESVDEMILDAETIINKLGNDVYIKIPVNENGLEAIKRLKEREFNLTATAIYTELQGFLAIGAGVDYLAPYYNRMENINVDAPTVIESLAQAIRTTQAQSKILAASFKNTAQMNRAIRAGAHALTADPDIYRQGLAMPSIQKAVTDFHNDWVETFESPSIQGLCQ